ENNDELLLFCGRPATPLGTERAPRHFGKVKARKNDPPELLAAVFLLAFCFQRRILQNGDNLINRAANLVCWHAGVRTRRIKKCRKTNRQHNRLQHTTHHSCSPFTCQFYESKIYYHQPL